MARKRIRETADILRDAIRRVAPSQRDVDTEGLQRYLGLPEHDGLVDDGRVASALTEMRGLKEWAAKGARELAKAVPSLRRSDDGEDGAVSWFVRVCLPLLDDGRMELRLMEPIPLVAVEQTIGWRGLETLVGEIDQTRGNNPAG